LQRDDIAETFFFGREPRRLGIINWMIVQPRAKLLTGIAFAADPRTPIGALALDNSNWLR